MEIPSVHEELIIEDNEFEAQKPAERSNLEEYNIPFYSMYVFITPEFLMELLLENHPKAASMTDDQGMRPIHSLHDR